MRRSPPGAVHRFVRAGHRASALICLNDRVAFGAYQALQEAGLRIPDDVSIVSFDDSDLASWLRPQLTSIAIPHFELDGERSAGVHRVPMPVRERASVGPPVSPAAPGPAPAPRPARRPRRSPPA